MYCAICTHSSFHHLRYGDYMACKECPCRGFQLKTINNNPIDDHYVVLDLLYSPWGNWRIDRRIRYLHRYPKPYTDPYLVFDAEYSKSKYFSITQGVIDRLLAMHLIQGKPEWGYTDYSELKISDAGKSYLNQRWNELGSNGDLRSEDWLENHAS